MKQKGPQILGEMSRHLPVGQRQEPPKSHPRHRHLMILHSQRQQRQQRKKNIKLTTKRGLAKHHNKKGCTLAGTAKHGSNNVMTIKSATIRRKRQPFPSEKFERHQRPRPQSLDVAATPNIVNEADTVNRVDISGKDVPGVSSIFQDDDFGSVSVGARSSSSAAYSEDPLATAENTATSNEHQAPLLEATLVTMPSSPDLSMLGDIVVAEPAGKESWARFIPNSIGGKMFFLGIAICATAIAVTGIVCGSGFCSSSDNQNDRLPSTVPVEPPATDASSTFVSTLSPASATIPTTIYTTQPATSTNGTSNIFIHSSTSPSSSAASLSPSTSSSTTSIPTLVFSVYSQHLPIYIKFLVNNYDIDDPATVNSSGLALAWPIFVEEVVAKVSRNEILSMEQQAAHRHLMVDLESGTSYIYEIVQLNDDCLGPLIGVCYDTHGTFSLLLTEEEDAGLVERTYASELVNAINAGTLKDVLLSLYPETTILEVGEAQPLTLTPAASSNNTWPTSTAPLPTIISVLGTSFSTGDTAITLIGAGGLSKASLPTEIGLLTSLTKLEIDNFELTGVIPTEIQLLTALNDLQLIFCELKGSIPSGLGLLNRLTMLSLRTNQFSGGIPTELGLLTSLSSLDFQENQLTGSITTELGLLTALTDLDLHQNQLIGSIPNDLGLLTAMTQLSLDFNQLSGTIPTSVCSLDGLELLVGPPIICPRPCGHRCQVNTASPTSSFPTTTGPTSAPPTTLSPTSLTPSTSTTTALPTSSSLPTATSPISESPTTASPTPESPITASPTPETWTSKSPITFSPTPASPPTESPTKLNTTTASLTTFSPTPPSTQTFSPSTARPTPASTTTLSPTTASPIPFTPTTISPTIATPPPPLVATLPTNTINLLGNSISIHETTINFSGFDGYNRIRGSIPTEIGWLNALTSLDLYEFSITGGIPTEIVLLTTLNDLRLAWCELNGNIPSELALLTALTYLHLFANWFSGSIPTELGLLTALKDLELGENQLSGSIPIELGQLTAIHGLHLYLNQLVGSIPTELGLLTELTELRLWGNQLSGTIPAGVCALDGLDISASAPLICPVEGCGLSCGM